MTEREPKSLWGPWLDEAIAWFENPTHEFCPCCGLLIVPEFFRRVDGETAREEKP